MVTLEQVKLLESKVGKALSYIDSLSAENTTLREKLEGYRLRIDELETIVLAFKEDQGRIEAGIISALERLNQFEDAVERGILEAKAPEASAAGDPVTEEPEGGAVSNGPESAEPEAQEQETAPADADESLEDIGIDENEEDQAAEEKAGELDIF